MNPTAPAAFCLEQTSDQSRLDVSTTAARTPESRSWAATSKPSMSGSWRSSRTTSGCSLEASATPLRAVFRLADHLEAVGLEDAPGAHPEPGMVIDDE
jgi:hypothetical protein